MQRQMHVGHMASHVSTCMSMDKFIQRERNQFIEEERNKKERKEKKKENDENQITKAIHVAP